MAEKIFNTADRSDPRWGWPGPVRDGWKEPTPAAFFPSIMSHRLTPDEVKAGREMFETGWEAMLSGFEMPEELAAAGEWREYYASGCVEEPDAPPVKLRVRVPKERKTGRLPAILYIFGAGFAGKTEFFDVETATYSKEIGCVVVAPQYRLHPDNKFPSQINDLHATYQWMVDNADELGIDPDCIALTGFSAGGLFSVALSHRLKRYGISPRGIVALMPPLNDLTAGAASRINFGGDPLGCIEVQLSWPSLLGVDRFGVASLTPEAVPGHATVEDAKGMPPVFLHVAEHDAIRDDSVAYAGTLLAAGVLCSLHVWPGICHTTFFAGPFNDYKKRFFAEVTSDLTDILTNDLRRPWTT